MLRLIYIDEAMHILVSGGAGFIGSHIAIYLHQRGYTPIILDNFSRASLKYAGSYLNEFNIIEGDIGNQELIKKILGNYDIKGIMHFAAYAYVGESTKEPTMYYENNVAKSISFLKSVYSFYERQVTNPPPIIFSSTCSVYGETNQDFVTETTPTNPLNPYGRSKLIIEGVLNDLFMYQGISSIAFRYFNAAGSDAELKAGEVHRPETHLIPLLIEASVKNNSKVFSLYGDDYPTKDGTCIRDYTHVSDIAEAHILGLEHLIKTKSACHEIINLGSGAGYSNLEILEAVERISGHKIHYKIVDRRVGDAAFLVANNKKAEAILGWRPLQSDLDTMIQHAHAWYNHSTLR